MKMNFTQRKFTLAMIAMVTSVIALLTDHLSGGEWIGAIGVILGLYGGANVLEKRNGVKPHE